MSKIGYKSWLFRNGQSACMFDSVVRFLQRSSSKSEKLAQPQSRCLCQRRGLFVTAGT